MRAETTSSTSRAFDQMVENFDQRGEACNPARKNSLQYRPRVPLLSWHQGCASKSSERKSERRKQVMKKLLSAVAVAGGLALLTGVASAQWGGGPGDRWWLALGVSLAGTACIAPYTATVMFPPDGARPARCPAAVADEQGETTHSGRFPPEWPAKRWRDTLTPTGVRRDAAACRACRTG